MGGYTSWLHWVVVLLIVVLIFGTKKLGNIGKDLGSAIRGFKEGLREGNDASESKTTDNPQQTTGRTIDVEVKK